MICTMVFTGILDGVYSSGKKNYVYSFFLNACLPFTLNRISIAHFTIVSVFLGAAVKR